MSIPIVDLTSSDYEILAYLNKSGSVSRERLTNKFSDKIAAFEYRLSVLAELEYNYNSPFPLENSSYIIEEYDSIKDEHGITHDVPKNSFHISPLGEKALQDYQLSKKSHSKELWLKNAWIPILVSTVMYLLLNLVIPMLLRIPEWLSRISEKTP